MTTTETEKLEPETETLKWHKAQLFETLRKMLYPQEGVDRTLGSHCGEYRIQDDDYRGISLSRASAKHMLAEYDRLTRPAPAGMREALEWIRDQRWSETADLDNICARAEAALASPPSNWVMVTKENPLPDDLKTGDEVALKVSGDAHLNGHVWIGVTSDEEFVLRHEVTAYRRSGGA